MKTITQILWSFLVLSLVVFGLGSCSQTDLEASEGQLTLSESEITLPGSSSSPAEVGVQSYTADWSYISGATWLHITRTDKGLRLSADPNTTGNMRHTTVGITAGNLVRKLEVRQQALAPGEGGSSISVETQEVSATQWGGVITIPVVSESQDWDVVLSEDWLTAVANPRKKVVVVTIPEAVSRQKRTANLLIQDRVGGGSVVVTITQDGQLYFLEPILRFGATMAELEAAETARRSTLLERPGATWSNTDRLKFRTISPLFTRVEYVIKNDVMTEGYVYASASTFISEQDAILGWLTEEGYEDAGPVMLINPKKRAVVSFGSVASSSEIFLRFVYKPEQTKRQPTFDTFPLGIVANNDWQTYTKARVHEWETAHQGETSSQDGTVDNVAGTRRVMYYPASGATRPFTSTSYTIKLNEQDTAPLVRVMHVLPDTEEYVEKVFWSIDGTYHLTEEFVALAKTAGFEYYGTERDGSHRLLNKARSTLCNVRLIIPSSSALNPFVTITYEYSPQ